MDRPVSEPSRIARYTYGRCRYLDRSGTDPKRIVYSDGWSRYLDRARTDPDGNDCYGQRRGYHLDGSESNPKYEPDYTYSWTCNLDRSEPEPKGRCYDHPGCDHLDWSDRRSSPGRPHHDCGDGYLVGADYPDADRCNDFRRRHHLDWKHRNSGCFWPSASPGNRTT